MPHTNFFLVPKGLNENVANNSSLTYVTPTHPMLGPCNQLTSGVYEFIESFEQRAYELLNIHNANSSSNLHLDSTIVPKMMWKQGEGVKAGTISKDMLTDVYTSAKSYQKESPDYLFTNDVMQAGMASKVKSLSNSNLTHGSSMVSGSENMRGMAERSEENVSSNLIFPRSDDIQERSPGRTVRDSGGYPEVVCKTSNTGLYSFLAFAILSLDITADIMATINIDINITGTTVTTNNTNVSNNTNVNNNNNTNTNTNTNTNNNNNGRRRRWTGTLNPEVGISLDVWDTQTKENGATPIKENGNTNVGETNESFEGKHHLGNSEDYYFTGEAQIPAEGYKDEEPARIKIPERLHQAFPVVHRRLLKRGGGALRRSYSQGYLKAWFQVLLEKLSAFI